jgi:addiction module RelB/DinJ family antitoxin
MKTILNIKTDREVKLRAQKIAKELGLPLSTVVNAYLKDFIRNKTINLSIAPRMSRQLEGLIGEVEKDIAAGRNIAGPFTTAAEIKHYLRSK